MDRLRRLLAKTADASSSIASERRFQDAIRLGIQSATAAVGQYLIMVAFDMPERFVGIISAVLVIEPTIGNTLVSGQRRFVATVVGCLIGVSCFVVLPDGLGTAVALAVSMMAMNAVSTFRPEWRYGVVAAVALSLKADTGAVQTAIDRSIAIGLGVVVGSVASLIIFPDKASQRARQHLKDAFDAIGTLIEATAGVGEENSSEADARGKYSTSIFNARSVADAVRLEDISDIKKKITSAERLYHLTSTLGRANSHETEEELVDDELAELLDLARNSTREARSLISGDSEDAEETIAQLSKLLEQSRSTQGKGRDPATQRRYETLLFIVSEIDQILGELKAG